MQQAEREVVGQTAIFTISTNPFGEAGLDRFGRNRGKGGARTSLAGATLTVSAGAA